MKTKICSKCGIEKILNKFCKNNTKKDKLQNFCKICNKIYRKKYKIEITKYNSKYYQEHKKERKKYCFKNKEKIRKQNTKYRKNKYNTDINFKILVCLRNRLYDFIKGKDKSKTTKELLGCSIKEFKNYFEQKFTKGMTWKKVMNGKIHIDHARPCNSYDLSNSDEQRVCFHYTNLQPLWAKENLEKSDKW